MTKTTQYKNTPIGPIPTDWEVKKLGDICKKTGSNLTNADINEKDGIYNVYGASGLIKQVDFFQESTPYISIVKDGAGVGRVLICEANSSVLATMDKIHNNENVNLFYLSLLLNNIDFEKYITGSTIPHIYFKDYKIKNIPLPPLPEQQKIAEVLSTWDKAIRDIDAIIKKLQDRNKALVNKLISFKNTSNHKKIKEVVDRVRNSLTPNKEELYTQIGIRSHAKGLFHKEPITGKELGNKSVFWIEPNCFIVNIVFAWEQAVAKTTDKEVGLIASHRFPMYKPKENILDLDYLLYLFKTPKGKDLLEFASPGGAGRNKTLGQSNFMDLKIPIYPIEEQRNIVKILNTANQEIKQYQQKLQALKLQKKGLMQQLLTGKVRTI